MKLATLRDGSRDGQLIVVSRDLTHAHLAHHIAPTLQRALDDWSFIAPQLEDLYESLNQNKARHGFSFEAQDCLAPLPRAYAHYQIDGPFAGVWPSDQFIGGFEPVRFLDEIATKTWVPGLAAITDHLAIAAGPKESATRTLLMMMCVQWMQPPAPEQLQLKNSQFAFAPVAVTPDELGGWPSAPTNAPTNAPTHASTHASTHAPSTATPKLAVSHKQILKSRRNDEIAVSINIPQAFGDFGAALSLIARGRPISVGSIVSMPLGASEALMMIGDRLRIDLKLDQKHSIFGEIDQTVMVLKR